MKLTIAKHLEHKNILVCDSVIVAYNLKQPTEVRTLLLFL